MLTSHTFRRMHKHIEQRMHRQTRMNVQRVSMTQICTTSQTEKAEDVFAGLREHNERKRKESWENLARFGGREAIEEFRQEMGLTMQELTTGVLNVCVCEHVQVLFSRQAHRQSSKQ